MQKMVVFAILTGGLCAFPAAALANGAATGANPSNDPAGWIMSQDYPADALRSRTQGKTVFQLSIDESGAITGCKIIQSSGSAELDTATCTLITQRGRFSPATDEGGRPVAGSYQKAVNWVLPARTLQAPPLGNKVANDPRSWVTIDDYPKAALRDNVQGTAAYRASIDTAGNVRGCDIVQSSGSKVLDDASCSLVMRRARFVPATDQNGRPAMGSYAGSVRWVIPNTIYRAPVAGTVVERMIVELDGKPSHCQSAGEDVGGSQLVNTACPYVLYQPYRKGGQAVRKLVTVTSVTTVTDVPN